MAPPALPARWEKLARRNPDLYPFEHHWLDRGGLSLHYLDEGPRAASPAAETVVMVHGNPTWSFYYRDLVKALRADHRCIVPDHIGMGLSSKPGDDAYSYSLESRVNDLEALLSHCGATRDVTLVVHDWGGMIGMAWAVRHPEAVKRLVILNTGAFPLPASKRLPWSLALTRTPLGALLVRGFNMFSRSAARVGCKRRSLTAVERAGYTAPYDSWANRIATLRFVQDIPLRPGDRGYDIIKNVEANLHRFRNTPVLVCWGPLDFVFDRHFLAEFRKHWPDADVHCFDDCGHYILEDAASEVIPLIRDFVARQPATPAAPGSAAAP